LSPIKRFFEIYTEAQKSAGRVVPSRADIGPDQLKDVLGWVFVCDWMAPDHMVTKLSGIHIDYVLRRNMTGVNCFDHYEPKDKPTYRAFYSAITEMTCGGYTRRRVMLDNGEIQGYYSIYLPVIGVDQRVQIIGAVVSVFEGRLECRDRRSEMPDFRLTDTIGVFDIGKGQPDTRHLTRIDLMGELAAMEKHEAVPFDTDYRDERSYINEPRRVSVA
jgi:hypothetical protein